MWQQFRGQRSGGIGDEERFNVEMVICGRGSVSVVSPLFLGRTGSFTLSHCRLH